MNAGLQRLLDAHDGVVAWSAACRAVSEDVVGWATRSGQLVLPYPRVLVDPLVLTEPAREGVLLRAALECAGPGAALSHTSALSVWRLPVVGVDAAVHVTTDLNRRIRVPGIVGHRRAGFAVVPPWAMIRNGLPVTALDATLVDSWPLLSGDAQRAPVIMAIANRMTTCERIDAALRSRPNLPQRAGFARLLGLVRAGCRSPLELWGHEHVFRGPGFDQLKWQVPVDLSSRRVWLDALDEESLTNFELDGAAYHSAPKDRERDLRRDAALATLDIHVVRFSHARLRGDVRAVRREALDIMAIRRARRRRTS